MDERRLALVLIAIWSSLLQSAEGVIKMQGCTEAFFQMTCPGDDILEVYDVRFSEVDPGHPCEQQEPSNVLVPKELTEECLFNKTGTGQLLCTYVEDICEGKSTCTFYISPHLIACLNRPTLNSEVIIKYECKAGKKRKSEIGAALFVVVFSICSLISVGVLTMWRQMTQKPSDYMISPPISRQPVSHTSQTYDISSTRQHQGAAAACQPSDTEVNQDQVTVEFRNASPGISHIQT